MHFKQREIRELYDLSSLYEYVTFEKRRCQNRWLNTTLDVVKQYCKEFPGILITRGGKDNQYPIFYAVCGSQHENCDVHRRKNWK